MVYFSQGKWNLIDTNFHKNAFSLGGGGTKSIPISRPKILVNGLNIYLLFRDEERNNKISLAFTSLKDKHWEVTDISDYSVGQWEPNFDKELWKEKSKLHIFSQNVNQIDGEGLTTTEPTEVKIIEVLKLPL